jgi:hypothetical protein
MNASEVAIVSQGEEKEREDMHASSSYRMQRPLSHGLRYLPYPQTLNPALGPRNLLVRERRSGVVQYGGRQMMHGWRSMNEENEI